MNRKIVAFIPVRGGSKSIPLKNIKQFCGKPLVYWCVKAAVDCSMIDEVYVSTDSDLIKQEVDLFGFNKVKVISRSVESSTDSATTERAMLEFASSCIFSDIVLIQATSPLLESEDLNNGLNKYLQSSSDSLLSVVRQKRFIWNNIGEEATPVNYDPQKRPRRQEWEGFYVENGAFYITSREAFLKSQCRLSGKIGMYEMPEDTFYEIDELADWIIAEGLKKERIKSNKIFNLNLSGIKLLICDVDGVMTDAGMYYASDGTELKKFNARDGKGIELVRTSGIKVMMITSEDNDIVKNRAKKLNVDFLYAGIKDKKALLDSFFHEYQEFSFLTTAYIGDDVNDLDSIQNVYFSAAPANACDIIKENVSYISVFKGGEGCVRDVCDFILRQR